MATPCRTSAPARATPLAASRSTTHVVATSSGRQPSFAPPGRSADRVLVGAFAGTRGSRGVTSCRFPPTRGGGRRVSTLTPMAGSEDLIRAIEMAGSQVTPTPGRSSKVRARGATMRVFGPRDGMFTRGCVATTPLSRGRRHDEASLARVTSAPPPTRPALARAGPRENPAPPSPERTAPPRPPCSPAPYRGSSWGPSGPSSPSCPSSPAAPRSPLGLSEPSCRWSSSSGCCSRRAWASCGTW